MPCWVVSSGSTVILRCRYLMYVRLRCELAFDRRCRCGRRSYAGSFSLIGLRTGAKAFLTIERGLETTFRSGEMVMHTRVWSCFGLVFGIGDEIDVVLNFFSMQQMLLETLVHQNPIRPLPLPPRRLCPASSTLEARNCRFQGKYRHRPYQHEMPCWCS